MYTRLRFFLPFFFISVSCIGIAMLTPFPSSNTAKNCPHHTIASTRRFHNEMVGKRGLKDVEEYRPVACLDEV